MEILHALLQAVLTAFSMFWEILWPLILGFALSGIVQAVVSHQSMAKTLGCDGPKCLSFATLFGIASSSCSYAAVALARSIFQKGASFTAAMAFELASTNLVIELGIILVVLMGWQFAAAEFVGGILMVIFIGLIFRLTLTPKLVQMAKTQAEKGMMGRMEGHAAMDMSVSGGSFFSKLLSGKGLTAVSNFFVMDWASVWVDILLGLLIAGALAAWVPDSFWRAFFFTSNPTLAKIEGPLVGPFVALVSFVCSVGNVPLAAVLWKGGISFGRGQLHLCRSDCLAHSRYLSQILWLEGDGFHSADLLRDHGRSRVCGRISFRGAWHYPAEPHDCCHHRGDPMELHEHPEYHLSCAGSTAGDPIYPHRRITDAWDDEYT